MTDVSKCPGDNCTKKATCKRYKALGSYPQAYIDAKPCIDSDYSLYWPASEIDHSPSAIVR